MEAFNKELTKQLFKPINAQEFQVPEKVPVIWVRYLNRIVNKMNNKRSLMIDMKPKDAMKLDIVKLDKSTLIPKTKCYPKMVYTDIYIDRVNNMGIKKDNLLTLLGLKIHIG